MQSGSTFKKKEKNKKRSTLTCLKTLSRYNLRYNNCVIFSVFLYFKYSFLFVHWKKSYQLLICRVAKNLPVLKLLNHFIKPSTVAYKRVAYKRNLVYYNSKTLFRSFATFSSVTFIDIQMNLAKNRGIAAHYS